MVGQRQDKSVIFIFDAYSWIYPLWHVIHGYRLLIPAYPTAILPISLVAGGKTKSATFLLVKILRAEEHSGRNNMHLCHWLWWTHLGLGGKGGDKKKKKERTLGDRGSSFHLGTWLLVQLVLVIQEFNFELPPEIRQPQLVPSTKNYHLLHFPLHDIPV